MRARILPGHGRASGQPPGRNPATSGPGMSTLGRGPSAPPLPAARRVSTAGAPTTGARPATSDSSIAIEGSGDRASQGRSVGAPAHSRPPRRTSADRWDWRTPALIRSVQRPPTPTPWITSPSPSRQRKNRRTPCCAGGSRGADDEIRTRDPHLGKVRRPVPLTCANTPKPPLACLSG